MVPRPLSPHALHTTQNVHIYSNIETASLAWEKIFGANNFVISHSLIFQTNVSSCIVTTFYVAMMPERCTALQLTFLDYKIRNFSLSRPLDSRLSVVLLMNFAVLWFCSSVGNRQSWVLILPYILIVLKLW